MIFDMRKALAYHMFSAIEPKRSNCPNQLNKKDLVRPFQHTNGHLAVCTSQIKITAISTVGGD